MKFDTRLLDAHILVVDDEEVNVRLVEASLLKVGCCRVKTMTDPERVIEWCSQHPVDLILLDLSMPRLHGLDLMQLMNTELTDVPQVIVLTALTSTEDKLKALELGALDYLTKPLHMSELLLRVRNGLRLVALTSDLKKERDNLSREVHRQTQELEATRDEVLYRLGRASEYRDNETGAHISRMAESCYLLALKATGDECFAAELRKAAQMHDLGKIGIPDGVLLKQGKLNEREWDIMRTHVRIGYDILSDARTPLMKMAAQIALTHHERWDGSGYPAGLSGEEIPLESRIVALCDVYDALRSVRPYKNAWNTEDACAHIKAQAGRHFDPSLVAPFLNLVDSIEENRRLHPDPDLTTEADQILL